jgi:cytochrome c oxidase subunit II
MAPVTWLPVTPKRFFVLGCALGLTAFGTSGCVPAPVTVQGESVERLYNVFLLISAVVFVIVAGLITWSLLRYRAKPADTELPKQFDRNLKLELIWFAIPQLIVVGLFVISTLALHDVNAESPDPSVKLDVEGFQWGWRFTYAGSDVEVVGGPQDNPTVVLPVGRPIQIDLSSPDVQHAFWVSRWLMKRDMIPGQENRIDVTIEEEGTYRGVCAEFCGLLHERMGFEVRAVSSREYEQWLEQQRAV